MVKLERKNFNIAIKGNDDLEITLSELNTIDIAKNYFINMVERANDVDDLDVQQLSDVYGEGHIDVNEKQIKRLGYVFQNYLKKEFQLSDRYVDIWTGYENLHETNYVVRDIIGATSMMNLYGMPINALPADFLMKVYKDKVIIEKYIDGKIRKFEVLENSQLRQLENKVKKIETPL